MMKKRCLFDIVKTKEELEVAKQKNDIILKTKLENRLSLNSSVQVLQGRYDTDTLDYVIKELKKFNKDKRSYGINTGVDIAIDIIEHIKYRSMSDERD